MATKKENRELVIQLADELGLEFEIPAQKALSAAEWEDMVSDLKAKKRDADNETIVDDAVKVEEAPAASEADESAEYYVLPGCAITSRKGVQSTEKKTALKDCTVLDPAWFVGGVETLERHVASGHLGKR